MRAPEAPIGWPSAQAPPWMLTLAGSSLRSCMRGHGDHGEGFVDLVQIDRFRRPAGLGEQFLHGADRGGREQGRVPAWVVWPTMRATGLRPASRPARRASSAPCAAAPSEIDEELAGVTVPSFLEGRLQGRDLVDIDGERAFVLGDDDIALRRRR